MTNAVVPPLSRFRRAGDFIFVSGQLPRGADGHIIEGGIDAQAECAIRNLERVLAEAGAGLDAVIKVTAWLTCSSHLPGFNEVYRRIFTEPFPARSTVFSGLVAGDVEIEAIAFSPLPS